MTEEMMVNVLRGALVATVAGMVWLVVRAFWKKAPPDDVGNREDPP